MKLALACLLCTWCTCCFAADPKLEVKKIDPKLEAKLVELAKAHSGKVALGLRNLSTGESYFLNGDEPMPTASLIKVPVMFEVYQQVEEKKVKLTDLLTLKESDKVPGSGILTEHFSEGTSLPLRDAVRLMIVYSDNTATNLVLDKIGLAATNHRLAKWGYTETRIHAKVFLAKTTSLDPERSHKFGLGSTTAREMVGLFTDLHDCRHCTTAVKQTMLAHLKRCDDKEKFPRLLPPGATLYHKTGSVSDARTDAGLIYLEDQAIALCVLTADNQDKSWSNENAANLLCSHIAKHVVLHYQAKK